jgi:hypothetical protein
MPTYPYNTHAHGVSVSEACTSVLNPVMERNFSCASNLNAFSVPLINLMFHFKHLTTNSKPHLEKEARASSGNE